MQHQSNLSGISLWGLSRAAGNLPQQWFWGRERSVCLDVLSNGTYLPIPHKTLVGRNILILTGDQLSAALALLELDGAARRIVLCPPDFATHHLWSTIVAASIDLIVCDSATADVEVRGIEKVIIDHNVSSAFRFNRAVSGETEWVLLTSGTTGPPKLVVHTLTSLTGAIANWATSDTPTIWSTFYDIRRYGGLQILLRAIRGGTSILLSSPAETASAFLDRAASHGVTHMSGTPSHWRRALMSPITAAFTPRYVRLSGEVADQMILDRLRDQFPCANVAHAFASTEAGVAFEVVDGFTGFPAGLIGENGHVTIMVKDGSLRIKSDRTATRYLGIGSPALRDADDFVDTGDFVGWREGRYYFVGRRDGVINIGGLKVHPEEVEAVINRHPAVRMCRVKGRSNAITGAIVSADVMADLGDQENVATSAEILRKEIVELCRHNLARHKVPAVLRFVTTLELSSSGKVER